MCLPVLGLASGIVNAVSGIQSSNAQAASYNEQARQAEAAKQIAELNAQNAAIRGAQQEQQISRAGKQIQGQILTGAGASNIDTSSGSVFDILNQSNKENTADIIQNRLNTANEVWSQQKQQENAQNTANVYKSAAKNASAAGWMNAGTTLLGSASNLANDFSNYKKVGGKNSFWKWK